MYIVYTIIQPLFNTDLSYSTVFTRAIQSGSGGAAPSLVKGRSPLRGAKTPENVAYLRPCIHCIVATLSNFIWLRKTVTFDK